MVYSPEELTDFWIHKVKHGGIAVVGLKTSRFGCEISQWITNPHKGSGTTADCGYTIAKMKVVFFLMDYSNANGLLISFSKHQ